MSVRFLLSGVALVALTACGGGGGGGGGVDLSTGPTNFAGLVSETERLTSYLSSTPTSSLPTNDTATYDGIIVIAADLPETGSSSVSATGYVGQVKIEMDFGSTDADITSGAANNFYSATLDSLGDPETLISGPLGGSPLTIAASNITGNDFGITVDGTLESQTVDGEMTASFATSNARAIIAREDGDLFLVGGNIWDARLIADDRSR